MIGILKWRRLPLLLVLGAFCLLASSPERPEAATAPQTPSGITAIALNGKTGLAWPATTGASTYAVYRGTSAASITTQISPAGLTATSFTDATAANGTKYFYAVRALASDGTPSGVSKAASATPLLPSCTTGIAVVKENCFPGTAAWKVTEASPAYPDGIEGFVSAASVNAGGSVSLTVKTDWDVPYRVEIYRTGWYGGTQGRLIGSIHGLTGEYPPPCLSQFASNESGLVDCSGWPVATTISTTTDWQSGVYMIKLVREDNGHVNEIPLVVRQDGSHADIAYHIPVSTYQAYNRYGGKALYTGLSDPPTVVTGAMRAAKVSFDRPYTQPAGNATATDYYTRTDVATIGWLERQGYDVTYLASQDFDTGGARLQNHKVFISGSHDEYWSQGMYDAAMAARNAGTSLIFLGANAVYWKVRFEASPLSGVAGRVMVGYKTIESGPADPSGIATSTWRDPAGPNQPENALIGQMYVGENLGRNFPLFVSADEGKNRLWRYTTLATQAAGTSTAVGTDIVGWEWDSTVGNGLQPAGVQTVASTSVDGNLIQNNGAVQSYGSATQKSTIYQAASGAKVFSTGTNNWWRGLGTNVFGAGEPNSRIQQATANVLVDMGATPTTPTGVTVDAAGAPAVVSTTPTNGANGVTLTSSMSVTFDRELDPSTVDNADLTLTDFNGDPVAGTVTWDAATKKLTVKPDDTLESFAGYTAHLGTGVKAWNGTSLAAPLNFSFTTGPGTPPVITSRTPAANATLVPTDTTITAHTDRHLAAATVNGTTFSVRPTAGGGAIAATVTYNDSTRTITLTPAARLTESTSYTVTATTGIQARGDGTPMVANDSWSFTTNQNLKVSSTWPAFLASGISPLAAVRATFSRPISGAGISGTQFRLTRPDGSTVAATISYDATDRTATLTPDASLLPMTTYTATVTGVHASDGAPVDTTAWNFSTAASPPPAAELTGVFPADAAVGVAPGASIRASFDIPIDAVTVNAQNFTVTPDGGTPIAATISYDAANRKAILVPLASLAPNTHYTATLTTGIRTTTGAPLPTTRTWGFTTANCPCNLMSNLTPQWSGPVQDGRGGPGPFTYELGTKIEVTSTSELVALRYYRDPTETGTHVGRVWNAAGAQIASVTFQNESASGWQRQALATPLTLQPGQKYTISVGFNATYVRTYEGLASQRVSGPLRSAADGLNGVYNNSAGQFPTSSYRGSNYFVDGVVRLPGEPASGPQVSTRTPIAGATGVPRTTSVTATFNVRLDPSTINAGTFTLTGPDGAVPATVTYDDDERTATLHPTSQLDIGTTYSAHLNAAIKSEAEVPMSGNVNWSFTTVPPVAPTVANTSPVSGATLLSPETNVTATFDQAMSSGTLNTTTFKLTGPGATAIPASVTYDALTRTATLNPSADLSPLTTYTASLTSGAQSSAGLNLAAQSWTFTTSSCPCSLFGASPLSVSYQNLSTANGRSGGPWSLEMGFKLQVAQPAKLTTIRYFRETAETGTHTGRVWSSNGTLLAVAGFTGETSSGWQEAQLSSPLQLTPGQTYTVSVGLNSAFGMTAGVFNSVLSTGPLQSVADGQNGVFADAAGAFPTQSWGNSSYGIDATVR